jgi:pimeloyl-ACP methyl ester carboxylesterase
MTTTERPAAGTGTVGLVSAPNLSIDADGDTFAYRRFGNDASGRLPLLFLQHFRGNLDNWDPAMIDRLAVDREVILVDNRGVGGSTGTVPDNVTDMARDALKFVDALKLTEIDLLGFSLGGHIAQEIILLRPRLVRRVVLGGTAPQGAPNLHRWSDDVMRNGMSDVSSADHLIPLFFTGSEASRARGMEYLGRAFSRKVDRDAPVTLAARDAQFAALTGWGIPDQSKLNRLAGITQPVFVANGDNDTMMRTENSRLLADHLPNAQLLIYPDAGHGFLDQYPELFADHITAFLR